MAQPSSSHHGERHHRSERSSHHHHRTISSTTLLLVLSLILAVLAVMLSLPSQSGSPTDSNAPGLFSALNPKRAQQLVAREAAVTMREAEVARREAELLAGAPGGILPSSSPVLCPVCPTSTSVETVFAPAQTVIKEIVKEDSLTPPGWTSPRIDEILDRELKVAERERDISKREENLNRREHDASRRESWIMEQLIALGNDSPAVEEEYFYEPSGGSVNPRYRHLSRAAPSFETKEAPTFFMLQYSPYESYLPLLSLLRPGLGDSRCFLSICPPRPFFRHGQATLLQVASFQRDPATSRSVDQ
ncbi:hypothetical protein BDZ89DRAFT_290013 [Hymenopellis radicata]|nr:hypothetical protein BDZ89DRAFT_290013 [Hymenopellis radicata]